ncbi:MAG TPA: hypothetical protein VGN73_02785 [Gemmatimonadaceae bacterium]|nr:hypothetical protein [Gemmatimonadaceae bacterium]
MTARLASTWLIAVAGLLSACRGSDRQTPDSTRALPAVYPSGPGENTNWDAEAGPLMITAAGGSLDSVNVVLPYATDSTIESLQGIGPPITGMTFDLFGRSGKVASALRASPVSQVDTTQDCFSWPAARLQSTPGNWQVGFASGRAQSIALDSIEAMASRDSALLAAAVTQAAATLSAAVVDPTFRGLPFRVRSAYTFQLDTAEIVVADVVRTLNEEAKPRVEHLLIVGERPRGTGGKFDVRYFTRNAGPEDSTPVTEILSAVAVGTARRPVIVVNVQYDDGGKFGLVERDAQGKWHATWKSAYTDC